VAEREPVQALRAGAPRADGAARSGLASLLETVEGEARHHAETLLEDARRQAELRVGEAERSAAEVEAQASAAGTVEGEREARRRIALGRIETRRQLLQLRESNVERALELAAARLAEQLRGSANASLLADAVRAAARALGEDRVRVRARAHDRSPLASTLGAGPPAVEWDEGDVPEQAGVVVLSADRHRMVDMTIDGLLRRRRAAASRAAAEVLVGRRDTA